jgi:hypothetical protein
MSSGDWHDLEVSAGGFPKLGLGAIVFGGEVLHPRSL